MWAIWRAVVRAGRDLPSHLLHSDRTGKTLRIFSIRTAARRIRSGWAIQPARVEHLARHDGLTELLKHATFQSKLAEMLIEARDTGRPLAQVLSDSDHFKLFNDRHGH